MNMWPFTVTGVRGKEVIWAAEKGKCNEENEENPVAENLMRKILLLLHPVSDIRSSVLLC